MPQIDLILKILIQPGPLKSWTCKINEIIRLLSTLGFNGKFKWSHGLTLLKDYRMRSRKDF